MFAFGLTSAYPRPSFPTPPRRRAWAGCFGVVRSLRRLRVDSPRTLRLSVTRVVCLSPTSIRPPSVTPFITAPPARSTFGRPGHCLPARSNYRRHRHAADHHLDGSRSPDAGTNSTPWWAVGLGSTVYGRDLQWFDRHLRRVLMDPSYSASP